ncbi:MAG: PIG-L family deacetylase [Ruminococcaceae bacterium]|nr:PIG-L family deacetylase [Oscillospiraceae bacterium]
MRVLAIAAHPDDIEFHCAGTLLKCKERGDEVFLCTVNNGSMGHAVIMPDELSKIRVAEAKRSCDLAGFHYLTADIGDLQSYYQSREHKDLLVDIVRQAKPDLMFIQKPTDYMCDHIAASHLAFDAAFMATCPHYETNFPAIDTICPIYYMGTASEVGFNPTEYVDITDVYDKKIQMLMCHESQEVWLREHDNVDYTNECRILAEFRGMQCKVKYAEAFEPCMVAHRIVPKRLLP